MKLSESVFDLYLPNCLAVQNLALTWSLPLTEYYMSSAKHLLVKIVIPHCSVKMESEIVKFWIMKSFVQFEWPWPRLTDSDSVGFRVTFPGWWWISYFLGQFWMNCFKQRAWTPPAHPLLPTPSSHSTKNTWTYCFRIIITDQKHLAWIVPLLSNSEVQQNCTPALIDNLWKARGLHFVNAHRHGLYISVHACGCSAE